MKQKKKFIITMIVIPILVGLIVNFIYDKIKSTLTPNKSGFQVEFNFKIKFN